MKTTHVVQEPQAMFRVQIHNLGLPLVDREMKGVADTSQMMAWVKVRLGFEASALLSEMGLKVSLSFRVDRLPDQLSLLS